MIDFLLTPDKSSSLALKRRVAEQCGRMEVIIGTWPELLTQARSSHILPLRDENWQETLAAAVKGMKSAFWAASLTNVPAEEDAIIAIIGQHLTMLLEGVGPDRPIITLAGADLPARLGRRVTDFIALHDRMGGILPPDLTFIRDMTSAGPERQLRQLRVYCLPDWPRLTPWQQALVDVLNERAGEPDGSLTELMNALPVHPSASPGTLLHHLQANLFGSSQERHPLDESVRWLGCRDSLQEAEVAAGMIQKAMADNPSLVFSDIALLLPDDERYRQAADECFSHAGIPLSGLAQKNVQRDLGGEAVYYFLLCTKGLAPAMALASLLTSPLMPWDSSVGNRLAQEVAEGRFGLKLPDDADANSRGMLELVRGRITDTKTLAGAIPQFIRRLRRLSGHDHPLSAHRKRAEEVAKKLAGQLVALLGTLDDDDWDGLLRACQPQPINGSSAGGDCTREGVAVFHEGDEPWRQVKRLFVLGCCEGHYPNDDSRSTVFFDDDYALLRDAGGLLIETPAERSGRRCDIFRRQLCAASADVTLLLPRRDRMGKPVLPSQSVAFMASLIPGAKAGECMDVDALIFDLELCRGGEIAGVLFAGEQDADPPWQAVTADLALEADLVDLKQGAESPSRLETLMISPLAWIFDRMKIKPREWQPEQLDLATRGKLLHRVYEELFACGTPIPPGEDIAARTPGLLDMAVAEICPYLQGPEWSVEREHLKQEIISSARRWGEILTELGASVVGNEVRLCGTLAIGDNDLPIHGDADLLIELSEGRLLVVDYKTSSSKNRRLRMESGYDHQATLYSAMIRTGGAKCPEKVGPEVADKLKYYKENGEIRSLYYLTLDQQVLTDSNGWLPPDFHGEMGDGISREALPLIVRRIGQVRRGHVELNREGDEKEFNDQCGINAKYALDSSPLVRMFSVQAAQQGCCGAVVVAREVKESLKRENIGSP